VRFYWDYNGHVGGRAAIRPRDGACSCEISGRRNQRANERTSEIGTRPARWGRLFLSRIRPP